MKLIKVISGITIVSVPTGSLKRIDDMGVFITTAIFSIFAYVWMFIVLKVWSPDVVEIGEAILTLIFFILLVVLAFAADKYNSIKKKKLNEQNNQMAQKEGVTRDEFYRIVGVRNSHNKTKIPKKSENIKLNDDTQISNQDKDIEGERLHNEDFQDEITKHKKSVRDTKIEGETRKVSNINKINKRKKVKD